MSSHLLAESNPSTFSSSSSPPSSMLKNAASSAAFLFRSEHDSDADSMRIFMPASSEIEIKRKPLIPRTTSYTNDKSTSNQKKRRQRVVSEASVVTLSLGGSRRRFGRMTVSPSETFLITRLTFKLLGAFRLTEVFDEIPQRKLRSFICFFNGRL